MKRITKAHRAYQVLFSKTVAAGILDRGAFVEPKGFYPYTIHTMAGDLGISISGEYVHCCFDDAHAGYICCDQTGCGYSNPHSGKWNHYYFYSEGQTAEQGAYSFLYALDAILAWRPVPIELAAIAARREAYNQKWRTA